MDRLNLDNFVFFVRVMFYSSFIKKKKSFAFALLFDSFSYDLMVFTFGACSVLLLCYLCFIVLFVFYYVLLIVYWCLTFVIVFRFSNNMYTENMKLTKFFNQYYKKDPPPAPTPPKPEPL